MKGALQHIKLPEKSSMWPDSVAGKGIFTINIKPVLATWQYVFKFVENYHPEKVATGSTAALFNDTVLVSFVNLEEQTKTDFS